MQKTFIKKRDSSPYEDMFFGRIFLGRVPARARSKSKKQKRRAFRPVFYTFCGVGNPAEYRHKKLGLRNYKQQNWRAFRPVSNRRKRLTATVPIDLAAHLSSKLDGLTD